MSVASKSMLRQASLFYRVCQSSITRQTLLPLSTSGRYHAESSSTNTATEEGKSFDSVRKFFIIFVFLFLWFIMVFF